MKVIHFRDFSDKPSIEDISAGCPLWQSYPKLDFTDKRIIANGQEVPPSFIPNEGDTVLIRTIPSDPVTAVVVGAAVAVVSIFTGIFTAFDVQKTKDKIAQLEEDVRKQQQITRDDVVNLPFLRGSTNTIAEGKTQPYIIGEHLFTPYLMAQPFYQIGTGGHYYLAVLQAGFNKQVIRKVMSDDAPIKDFGDAGTTPQEGVYTFDASSPFYDADSFFEVAQDGADFTTADFNKKMACQLSGNEIKKADDANYEDLIYTLDRYAATAEISVSIKGLRKYNDDGTTSALNLTLPVYYSLNAGSTWTQFYYANASSNVFSGDTNVEIRDTATVNFTWAQLKNLTSPILIKQTCTTNKQTGMALDSAFVGYVQSRLYNVNKSATADALVYDRIIDTPEAALSTLIGIKIRSTESNQEKLGKINITTAGIARTWNGSAWSTDKTPTRNLAAWLLEILTSDTHKPSKVLDAEIDLDAFGAYYTECETEGLKVDYVLTEGDTKENLLAMLCQIGHCALYQNIYGEISVANDTVKANAIAVINTQNTISLSVEKSYIRASDGIRINYVSRGRDYQNDSYLIMRDGKTRDGVSVIQDITLPGVTEHAQVVKYARRFMAIETLRPRVIKATVGKEGAYYMPLALVKVQHPALSNGLGSAEIKSVIIESGYITQIEFYEPIYFDAGNANMMTIQSVASTRLDVLAAQYFRASTGWYTTVELTTPILETADIVPHVGDIVSWGAGDSVAPVDKYVVSDMLISGIEPADNGYILSLVDYNEAIYEAGTIPTYTPNTTIVPVGGALPTAPVTITPDSVMEVVAALPRPSAYLGRYLGAHPETYANNDWWTVYDTDDSPIQRGVWYSNAGTPARITTSSSVALQAKLAEALKDVAWAEAQGTYGTAADYGIDTLFQNIASVTALINTLVASNVFTTNLAAESSFITSLFTQNIEVASGGAIYYFVGSGATRRAVKIGNNTIAWGNYPENGAFIQLASMARTGTATDVFLEGVFNTLISSGGGLYTKELIHNTATSTDMIKQADGNYRIVYNVYQNGRWEICTRVYSSGAWGAETFIWAMQVNRVSIAQKADGQFIVLAEERGGYNTVRWIQTINGNWDSQFPVFNGYNLCSPDIIKKADGELLCVYASNDNAYVYQRVTVGGVWQTHTRVGTLTLSASSWYGQLIQQADGQFRIIYKNSSYNMCQIKTTGGTWGSEEVIINEDTGGGYPHSVCQQANGEYRLAYTRKADNFLCQRKTVSGVWGAEQTIIPEAGNVGTIFVDGTNYKLSYVGTGVFLLTIPTTEPVSCQLGAGIIESGSNSNGSWVKFSDGTMLQWAYDVNVPYTTQLVNAYGTTSGNTAYGSLANIAFPQAWYSNPCMAPTFGTGGALVVRAIPSSTSLYILTWSDSSTYTSTHSVSWHAIGRWKA